MLHECVINPSLLLDFAKNRRDYSDFIRKFTLGSSFIYCDFPQIKKMKRKIFELQDPNANDLEKTRLIELINSIGEFHKAKRLSIYNKELNWSENILCENEKHNFGHIISADNLDIPNYLDFNGFLEINYPLQKRIRKTIEDIDSSTSSLLRLSAEVILVDPYFKGSSRWLNVLKAIVASVFNYNSNSAINIVIIFDGSKQNATTAEHIKYNIQRVNINIPEGKELNIIIRSLSEKAGGPSLHNRYLLTELGGFCFPYGLDESDATDDIFILNKENHNINWLQYTDLNYYNVIEEVLINY